VLLYHSNPEREVGQLISNAKKVYKEDREDRFRRTVQYAERGR
jgi:hypothetical protein